MDHALAKFARTIDWGFLEKKFGAVYADGSDRPALPTRLTAGLATIVAKELQLRGTFRFDPEFELALRLVGEGLIDVKSLITASLPFSAAVDAFELASDRSKSMKVQLTC
jgi:threonine dehydrogenase-like Zn-dependent dehydrogenase